MKRIGFNKSIAKPSFKPWWLFTVAIFIILFISVGYSSLNTELNITGEAKVQIDVDTRITDCALSSATNGGLEDYECSFGKDAIMTGVTLPNLNSTVIYDVTVTNFVNLVMLIDSISSITFNNSNMEYVLSGINLGDSLNPMSNITFQIIFRYKASTTILPANTSLGSQLKFNLVEKTYALVVNASGGTWVGTTPQSIVQGGTATITAPTRTGYTFTGWTVTGTGSTIVGTTFTMGTANSTLTANWTINSYTLTVNANGGTWGGTTPQTINYNSTVIIANPTRTGYVFTGWTVSGAGSTMNGTTFTMGTANATITSNWLIFSSMYTYTGSSTIVDDGSSAWRIKFLTSGTFTPLLNMSIDVFLVGGGSSGGGSSNGGGGGGGGYTNTVSSINITANTAYTVTVGAGGNYAGDIRHDGFASYFGAYTAAGGLCATSSFATGGNGGSGGGRGGTSSTNTTGQAGAAYGNTAATGTGTGQGTTTCEFGQGTLSACNAGVTLYAGGGGGRNRLGGAGGGGNGYGQGDMHGDTNTGGGGGGGVNANVGVGGSGIVIIRNHR